MKLRLVTLAALAFVAGQAMAAPNTTPVTAAEAAGATNALYISGSSAAKAIISGLVQQNCNSGSYVDFQDSTGNYHAYACRVAATNDWALAENTVVVVNKRDDQGSAYGVFPVAYNTAIAFLNLNNCPTNTTCGTANHTADAGISDVEPALFNVGANRPAAFASTTTYPNVSKTSFASQTTAFSQVFGVAVTRKLYDALQTAQGTTGMPSLSRDYLANFFSQNVGNIGYLPLNVASADAGVNVCFRDQGSGTRVAGNVFFGNYPANNNSGWLPLDGSVATVAAPSDVNGDIYVNEAASGGDVTKCLKNVNLTGTGYGIGLLGLGTAETPADFKYVAVDGVAPSRDSAKVGGYGFWVESTIQVNKLSSASTAAKAWLSSFITKATYSTNLGQLSATAQNGVFALPSSVSTVAADSCKAYAGTFPVGGTTPADKFCSRFSRSGDNRALPSFVK